MRTFSFLKQLAGILAAFAICALNFSQASARDAAADNRQAVADAREAIVDIRQMAADTWKATADTLPGYNYPIRGTVFLDQDGDGLQGESERGMEGVAVSDGLTVVKTNSTGQYLLPNSGGDAVFVFVHQPGSIKQSGQEFFHLLKKEDAAADRFDFDLQPADPAASPAVGADTVSSPARGADPAASPAPGADPDASPAADMGTSEGIRFVQISDSHIRNPSDKQYMQTAVRDLYEMDPPVDFIVATGDLVDWGVEEHYKNYVAGMLEPPVPYFNVFGNHELLFGPIERFHQYIGPDYYSFERGGILFLSLNCVTPSERQDTWLANTLKLLGGKRPVVIFQHFPPSLEDLERFRGMGVKSVFSGHWHSEKEMEHAGVQSFNSPTFIMGGIDASPAGFKVVHMKSDGRAETAWRYGFQNKSLTIVSPGSETEVAAGLVPFIVNTYDSSHEIAGVSWRVEQDGEDRGSGKLKQESAISWTGAMEFQPGNYSLLVTVRDAQGTTWASQQQFRVIGAVGAMPSPGEQWPMFMGNAGHTGYTPESIGRLPLRLAWSRDTGGDPDFSSPILAGGRLFLAFKKRTGNRVNGVAAFDPVNCEKQWQFETDLAVNHTPAYSNGVVCIAEMGGRILGLDAATGEQKWEHTLIDEHGRYSYCAPAAYDGSFYAGVMRRMARLDAVSGRLEWEKQAGPADNDWISSYGSPAVSGNYVVMSGMFFVGEALAVLRADDGTTLWRHRADNGMLSSPAIAGDVILFTSHKSVLYARKLSNADSLWQQQLGETGGDGKWSSTTPAVKMEENGGGIVVAGSGDGNMYGLDLKTGKIKWKHTSGPAVFKMSPYRRDDRPLLSSPAIAGNQVFFGSADGYIYCLDLSTGEELWSWEIGVPVLSSPLISGNTLYIAACDGRLYAFTAAPAS